MVTRPCILFPHTPLKFRTAGFPKYGFKPALGRHLRRWAHTRRYRRPESRSPATTLAPRGAIAALSRHRVAVRRNRPVQRPLARQRVILSRRVIAYYGLIRGSRSLPSAYVLRRRVFALRPKPGDSLLYSACPSVRAVCRTPADRVVNAASNATRVSLRPSVKGSASAMVHAEVGSRVVCLTRLHSSLYAAARTVAGPAPTQDVYLRAFIP